MSIFVRIYFSVFLFSFLCWGQGDVLTYIFSICLGRPAPHVPAVWALLLSALAAWSLGPMATACRRRELSPFLPCVAWGWGVTAGVSWPHAGWNYQCALLATAIVLALGEEWWHRCRRNKEDYGQDWWANFMPSAVGLLVVSLFMGGGASTTDVQHDELQVARCLLDGQPRKALKVAHNELATSPRLLAMRCYAMAERADGLGERIFEQPFPPSASAETLLLPDDNRQGLLMSPDSLTERLGGIVRNPGENALAYLERCANASGTKPGWAADYYLCALLVERRVDRFAHEVCRFYGNRIRKQQRLPHYYAEALVMYARMRTNPVLIYRDAAVEANLRDYSEMRDSITAPAARRNLLCRSYGGTYWWYYTYGYPH